MHNINHDTHYFSHEADVGLIGRGKTIEAAFVDAAKNMFAIMADLRQVKKTQSVLIEFDESDVELAFVTWLNLLLAEAGSRGLIFSQFDLSQQGAHWKGEASGEPWRDEMIRGVEVKGATLTMLSLEHKGDTWEVRCVVDV